MRRPTMRNLAVVWLLATVACGENPQPSADGGVDATPGDAALDAGSYSAAALGSSSVTEDGRTWTETRYRVTRPDGEATYVQWIPSDRAGARPVVRRRRSRGARSARSRSCPTHARASS